jgi:hypothetical protein
MHCTKRKHGDVSPSPTPPPFSFATPAETDSRPPTLSPDPAHPAPKRVGVLRSFDCRQSTTNARRVTEEEVQKMRSFPETIAIAFAVRRHQARIHSNTSGMMHVHTSDMFALASRDYQRQHYAPTRRTSPVLLRRRYTIDVNLGIGERPIGQVRDFPGRCRGSDYPQASV